MWDVWVGTENLVVGRKKRVKLSQYKTKSHVHSCRTCVSTLLNTVKPPESLLISYHIIIYTVRSKQHPASRRIPFSSSSSSSRKKLEYNPTA